MIYNQLSEYLLKHLAQVQTLMMMSASSEDAGFRSITRKSQFICLIESWKLNKKRILSGDQIDCFVETNVGQRVIKVFCAMNLICEIQC